MDSPKKMKIVFAPGCFDNMDMSQEELDEFVKMLETKVEDGSLLEESRSLDPDDPEDAEIIERLLQAQEDNEKRKLQ